MKRTHTIGLSLLFVCLLSFPSFTQSLSAAAPIVRKIDPPNWWVNYTPELTLLLTGENLNGARVESPTRDVTVDGANASANGHYLFVHLRMSSSLPPGNVSLRLITAAGSATVPLPLLARAEPRGHCEGFSRDDVIYLIMPDRFADGDKSNDQPPGSTGVYDRNQPHAYHGGDLRGIRQHLDYLHDLGVTTLWLTPVWKNADSDFTTAITQSSTSTRSTTTWDLMQEYQALVADAHKLGMKVLIDYVVNHTGPHHPWANDPPTPTWFHGTPEHHLEPAYTFNGLVDPHASPREYLNTLDGWFANKLPDLNPDDPELGLYLAQNAMWWTEMAQLDGFRLDTFPYSTRQFWSEWHERIRRVYPKMVYPHVMDIGEVADGDSTITSFFEGGRIQFDGIDSGLATVFDFPLRNALRDVIIKGMSMEKIVAVLQHDELYPHPETLVTFIGNHDDTRFLGEKGSNPAKLKAAFSSSAHHDLARHSTDLLTGDLKLPRGGRRQSTLTTGTAATFPREASPAITHNAFTTIAGALRNSRTVFANTITIPSGPAQEPPRPAHRKAMAHRMG